MKGETAYRYQQRIKNLQKELEETRGLLGKYRQFSRDVFDAACDCVGDGKSISTKWLIRKTRAFWKEYPHG